jgi:hypothetical protein
MRTPVPIVMLGGRKSDWHTACSRAVVTIVTSDKLVGDPNQSRWNAIPAQPDWIIKVETLKPSNGLNGHT